MLGTVYLVGAGPGDPGLITVRGRELLAAADCVLYDYLVNPLLLDHLPTHCERHYVGKKSGQSVCTQEQINRMLVETAQRHRRIVRLKGGDPYFFGRGGEEAQELAAAGVPFVVVPGITSGVAAPAYAGIPVTHREACSAVTFVTGHSQPAKDLDWTALAKVSTLVIYMGVGRIRHFSTELVHHGMNPEIPAAAIRWGTYPHQEVVTGTLATLADRIEAAGLKAPAIIVFGQVAAYRDQLRWFDARPLFGKRILVTRSQGHGSDLIDPLTAAGAEVDHIALNRQEAVADPSALHAAIGDIAKHDWLVFTSANGVRYFFAALGQTGGDARRLAGCRIACIGRATAAALRSHGIVADLVPSRFDATALAADITASGATQCLLPLADNARPTLAQALEAKGCRARTVVTYHNRPVAIEHTVTEPDAATFASSETVRRFVDGIGGERLHAWQRCRYYAIGHQTADTLRECGLQVAGVPERATLADLAKLVIEDLDQGGPHG